MVFLLTEAREGPVGDVGGISETEASFGEVGGASKGIASTIVSMRSTSKK